MTKHLKQVRQELNITNTDQPMAPRGHQNTVKHDIQMAKCLLETREYDQETPQPQVSDQPLIPRENTP